MNDNQAVLKIGADVSGAMGGINQLQAALPGLQAAIAGGFSIAAITAFVSASINAADELNDLSQKTGIAVETLAGFKLVAEQNGATLDSMARGVKNLSTYMQEHGDKLRKVGIDAKSADGAMLQLSDIFSKLPDGLQKSALATELFGKAGVDLIPMLNQGSQALGDMIAKGQQLNPITTEMAKQADAFNDSMAELKAAAAGAGTSLANSLLPALNSVISRLNEGIQATGSLVGGINALAMGTYSDRYIKDRIADYETGDNAYSSTPDQIAQLKREENRRRDEISARIVGSYGAIDSREGYGRSTAGASIAAANAAATGILGKQGRAVKAPKEPGGFRMSAEESALLDEWSSKSIAEEMEAALAELQDGEDQRTLIARAARDKRLADLDAGLMTEREREQLGFAERMAFLASAEEQERLQHADNQEQLALIDEQYKARREEIELQHQAKLGDISAQASLARRRFDELNTVQQAAAVSNLLTAHLGAVSQKNRAFFYAHKLGSIAQATISTYEGANKALAMGPIIGPPLAAMMIAAGLANVAQIKSQNFTGGGSGGGGALPSYPNARAGSDFVFEPPPVSPSMQAKAEAPRQQVHVTLVGDGFTYKDVAEKLIPLINEAVGNGIDITAGRG